MPTLWAHQNYFNNSSTAVAPVVLGKGGYPAWQHGPHRHFYIGSMLGALQTWWDKLDWRSIVWALPWIGMVLVAVWQFRGPQRRAVMRVLKGVTHPAFPVAYEAVQQTAKTLGFNRPEAWAPLSKALKADPGQGENTFRHLQACHLTKARLENSTVTNPELHMIVELAYQAWRDDAHV
jgi:hypothetical protein